MLGCVSGIDFFLMVNTGVGGGVLRLGLEGKQGKTAWGRGGVDVLLR